MSRFDTDTTVEPIGPGRYRAHIDEGWWAGAGPNGGYVGAILLRALEREVGDPARACRSFTVHYLSRPRPARPRWRSPSSVRGGRSPRSPLD